MKITHILEKFDEPPRFTRHKEKTTKERANGKVSVFFNVVNKPNKAMQAVHDELITMLEKRLTPFWHSLPNAIAVKGTPPESIFYRLERKRYITKLDLFHAYGSVKINLLIAILKELFPSWGSEKQIETFLRKYCYNDKLGLLFGAPASSLLFDVYCERLIDKKIRKLLTLKGFQHIRYMRYVDDFVFFSRDEKISSWFLSHARKIMQEAGFFENQWKAKSVDRNSGSIIVLGRQLGCLAPVIQMKWRAFSQSPNVQMKAGKLRHSIDTLYRGMPRKVVGMPTALPENKSVECLEREMYRASCGAEVKKPISLHGRMLWFVQSVHPKTRELSRTERKLVKHFLVWSQKEGLESGFVNMLNLSPGS